MNRLELEIENLISDIADNSPSHESIGFEALRFITKRKPEDVIREAKGILTTILKQKLEYREKEDELYFDGFWWDKLPSRLLDSFAPERPHEEAENELDYVNSLSYDDRVEYEKKERWVFGNWIYWFFGDERGWVWKSAQKISDNEFEVVLEIFEYPNAKSALVFLFRLLGAAQDDIEVSPTKSIWSKLKDRFLLS